MAMAVSNQQSRDAALLRATTELFALAAHHDADEIRRFEELATHFLGKVSAADRAFVAERLAKTSDAPASVLRLLGKDMIEIASPVLRRSPLSEIDLLSILSSTGPLHHRQIAQRSNLPLPVVAALRLAGDAETVALLRAYPDSEAAITAYPAASVRPPESLVAAAAPAPPAASAPTAPATVPDVVPLPAQPARDPAAREVFAAARAMTAALSLEMTNFATFRPKAAAPDIAAPEPAAAVEPIAVPEAPAADEPVSIAPPTELAGPESLVEAAPIAAEIAPAPESVPPVSAFLSQDARERAETLARLLGRAGPADPGMTVLDADNAFRVALGSARVSLHARRRQRDHLIAALAHGLKLDVESVTAIADDPSGEALVVLLRAIGLSEGEAHQVLLFANPMIAEAVETFFRLARLAGEISRDAAEGIVTTWRDEPAHRTAGHQPFLADADMRRTLRAGPAERRNGEETAERAADWRSAG